MPPHSREGVTGQMRLTQMLDEGRRRHPEAVALIDGARQITYGALYERSGRCAGMLQGLGVGAEDRVCILSLNSHRNLEALFGTIWAGGIAAPLNYRLSPAELAGIIAMVDARVLLVDDEFLDLGRRIAADAGCVDHVVLLSDTPAPDGLIAYEDAIAGAEVPPDAMRGGGDVATIFFTGGTTGLPRGVMQTHDNLVTSALMYVARWSWTSDIILLGSAPMFHVAAAAVIPPVLLAGGKIVMMPKFDPAGYAELIERHRITFANGVPTMFRMIVDAPGFADRDLTSLRGMNMGGSPMPVELLRQLVEGFPNCRFYNTYGMTEVTSAATVSDGVTRLALPEEEWQWHTIGWPTPLTEVRVFRPDDSECSPGEVGELRMRGPLVMKGYWRNPEATEAAIGDGWMRSGDLGYADDRGNFFLVDRLKDMIITGGENVYSTEVEAVIRELDAVSDVAVIGVPHGVWGESVHAAVVLRPGAALAEEQVIAHVRTRLAGYKSPRTVEIRAVPLPVSGAGKIAKTVLRRERIALIAAG
jgi:acyl-CoA synthetase (AMP-forming)/AMP-acid ligase II